MIVREANRDELYERMNAAGFGVVSLYHTLIEQIPRDEFPESFELSRTILNLPGPPSGRRRLARGAGRRARQADVSGLGLEIWDAARSLRP